MEDNNRLIGITVKDLKSLGKEIVAEALKLHNIPKSEVELPIGTEECCELIGCSKPTLYKNTSLNLIPHHKRGQKLIFFRSEIIKWIKQGRQSTIEEIKKNI